jgi:hypothetical protein
VTTTTSDPTSVVPDEPGVSDPTPPVIGGPGSSDPPPPSAGDPPSDPPIFPPQLPVLYDGVTVVMDGEVVTSCVQTGSVTQRLNRPWQATLRMFSDCDSGTPCSRVRVYIYGILWFHGFVTQISTEAGEDGNLMSEYTCHDPMWLWQWRPARAGPDSADPGDFSNPELFLDPSPYGPQILEQILLQSEDDTDPGLGEGTLFLEHGGFAAGVTDLSGAPTDYPMTIAEVFELLASTGTVDAVLTPIDTDAVNMAQINVYNGDFGTDLSGSVAFEYETGAHNVRAVRMTEDAPAVCNKLWYYLGPRVHTAVDPEGTQHWQANITGDRNLPRPPGGDTNPDDGYQGGVVPGSPGNELGGRILDSRASCGVRMEVRVYDAQGEEDDVFGPAAFVKLYEKLWQTEAWLRSVPRTLVHVTPVRQSAAMQLPAGVTPVPVGAFGIGDLVTVTAGAVVRGGFTGAQRVYEYTVTWDEDGVIEYGELLTSSDSEGMGG